MMTSFRFRAMQLSMQLLVEETMLLPFLVFCVLILSTSASKTASQVVNYVNEDLVHSVTPGECFPSCVEVVDVWPPPGSVLRVNTDILKVSSKIYYRAVFRITFSRPVTISSGDTSTGLYRKHQNIVNIDRNKSYYRKKNWGISTTRISPIFLTPSSNLSAHYYTYQTLSNIRGSNKTYVATIGITKKGFPQIEKALLVIDGGRFFTYEWVGTQQNRMFVPLTVVGEYYFEPFLRHHKWFKLPKPVVLKSSPHCKPRRERPYYGASEVYSEQGSQSLSELMVEINKEGHILEAGNTTESVNLHMELYLSVSTSGGGGTKTLTLPGTVKARYAGCNVTVKLPISNITFTQASSPRLFVPVERKLIYELRERIYHNGYKLSSMTMVPAFTRTVFSEEPLDELENAFPQRVLSTKKINWWEWFNMDIVDGETGVKLAWYYPFFDAYPVRGTKKVLRQHRWIEVTRTAPLVAEPDRIGYMQREPQPQRMLQLTKADFLLNNSRFCSPGSRRNLGRSGQHIENVIEYGSMYHMIVPKAFSTWWSEEATLKAVMTTGEVKKPVDIRAKYNDQKKSRFPSNIRKALNKYVCLLRPTKAVSKPNSWSAVNEKWVHVDGCIFVPRHIAESEDCGGLMLFKNVSHVINQPNFCNKEHSSCVGAPYSSVDRFPVIPTYGLHELTGWIPCASDYCKHLKPFLSHPVGRHAVGRSEMALPRSVLRFTKKKSGDGEAVLKLLPVLDANSKMEHQLAVSSGLKILRPAIDGVDTTGAQLINKKELCRKMIDIEPEPLSLENKHMTSALLTATVYNTGEGGGDFIFEMKCTRYLSFSPSTEVISVWINSSSVGTVKYVLSGELSAGVARMLHKCELTVRINGPRAVVGTPSLVCERGIVTYFGCFQDPCHKQSELPDVEMMYFVLPPMELLHSKSFQFFNNSPAAHGLSLMRAMTLMLSIPREQEHQLHQLKVVCANQDILLLQEDQLILFAARAREDSRQSLLTTNEPIVFHRNLDTNKRLFLFSTKLITSLVLTKCSVELSCWRPNWLCKREAQVIEKLFIPLTKADTEELEKAANPHPILSVIFGQQSSSVYASLIACMVVSFILLVTTATGHGLKYAYRKKLPKPGKLKSLEKELKRAEKKEQQYWDNPQVFLTAGDQVFGSHFILHNFKATQPLDTEQIKSLKIAATLKHNGKELQVLFGHVKKIFLNRNDPCPDIWVQASSGMYRLPTSNVAAEYRATLIEFMEKNGVDTTKIKELRLQEEEPQVDDDGDTKESSVGGRPLIREEGASLAPIEEEQTIATTQLTEIKDDENDDQETTKTVTLETNDSEELDDMLIDLDF